MYTKVLVLELQKHVAQTWLICDCHQVPNRKISNVQYSILALHISLEKLNTYYSALHQG